MKRFGYVKFAPKPKTEKDWTRIYNRHKYEIPTVKKLTLTLSSKGAGQTGARHFKAYALPPIKYWNPNIAIDVSHDEEKPVPPTLLIEFTNGETRIADINGAHVDKIKSDLFAWDAAKRTSSPANPPL